jgi:3-oxoacyl-[acyl-carrier-protein] synthase I
VNAVLDSALAIQRVGLITAVGASAPASCAAARAKISNPSDTRFTDGKGRWILAHQVELERPWRGITRLARMAAMAIEEALYPMPRAQWRQLPMILCVAEFDRPGRAEDLDSELATQIRQLLGVRFDESRSTVIAQGRVALAVALKAARGAIAQGKCEQVLVVAADSLIGHGTLSAYEREGRLLTDDNSNGFMPGEAVGALLLGRADRVRTQPGHLLVTGLGFASESAHITSDEPLRGEGLAAAVKGALSEAGLEMHDIDHRIADLSGEHFYFKEASLALSRTLRGRKDSFDLWHPAECTGEVGAASGAVMLAVAEAACRKGYALGRRILAHWASDSGHRAAATLQWQPVG